MKQTTALAILDSGESVFLTGAAGAGKTYVLNSFIQQARADGKSVAVTASTGIAATHLGGNTIHAWSGVGIADTLHDRMVDDMSKTRQDQINKADILVIDEVSMLHDFRLDMVDQICRGIRGDSAPFGGLQVVLSGDFYQLPPINREDSRQGGFITSSQAWEELDPVVCYLHEQYRQEDDQLLDILTALRANDLRRRHAEALLERRQSRTPFDEPVTELYTRNVDVDAVNHAKLAAMEGEVHEFDMSHSGRASAYESLKKSCLAPELLQLKDGAFVMFVKNAQDRSYVNGTLGTVTGFDEESGYPIVTTRSGRLIQVVPDTWEMRDGEKKIASVTQLPLRLAWAITIHKSQGMTLDGAHIDLGNAFVPGMGYVALSRVKRLQSLTLGGLNRTALLMHEQAHELDENLRSKSSSDSKRFSHLVDSYEKKQKKRARRTKHAKMATAGPDGTSAANFQDRIKEMRKDHPNAFKRWTEANDELLISNWKSGNSVPKLAGLLGRHEGSVRARLKKHFGEEYSKGVDFVDK